MHRHKFPRLKQSFTIQGLSLSEMIAAAIFLYLGWQLAGMVSGHPLAKIGGAIAAYMFLFPRIKVFLGRFPPGWFNSWVKWLTTKDYYLPLPDETVKPLISYHKKDENIGALSGEKGLDGQHLEPVAASGHR